VDFAEYAVRSAEGLKINPGSIVEMAGRALDMRGRLFQSDERVPKDAQAFWIDVISRAPDIALFSAALSDSERQEIATAMHAFCSWVEQGLPAYDLTHSLMASLLLTDPAGVNAADFRLPFETFFVRLPSDFWFIERGDKPDPVLSLIIHHCWIRDSERLIIKLDAASGITLWEILGMPATGKLASWLHHDTGRAKGRFMLTISEREVDTQMAARRLVANLCLYLTSRAETETPERKVRTAAHRTEQGARFELPHLWVLGREVKLDKNLVRAAKDWTQATRGDRSGWRLRSRFTVSGHWRNQAHGPGRTERRPTWIKPFWKGGVDNAAWAHVYKKE
jgi:hypothetical protein